MCRSFKTICFSIDNKIIVRVIADVRVEIAPDKMMVCVVVRAHCASRLFRIDSLKLGIILNAEVKGRDEANVENVSHVCCDNGPSPAYEEERVPTTRIGVCLRKSKFHRVSGWRAPSQKRSNRILERFSCMK